MNKILAIIITTAIIASIFTISSVSEQFADAGSRKKIHFTQTISSSQDPGQGHEGHQLALILSPNEGTLYDGSLTYTASEPVEIVVLHELNNENTKGQPTWTVDGNTVYALSFIEPGTNSGSFEFTGAALALHTKKTAKFTTTVSVDGWIRGQPTEILMQTMEVQPTGASLKLARSNVPATIPMHKGFYDGSEILYIVTDASDKKLVDIISEKQNWKVELAPSLSNATKEALETVYVFTDGNKGEGIFGYQDEVFSNIPSKNGYSALQSVIYVSWKIGQNPQVLDSVQAINEAKESSRIELEETQVVLNMPQIVWPDGQMIVKEDKTVSDDMEYGGGQVIDINKDEMTVTFIAHRGWGPDGKTIYYIVTDATPSGPAKLMGVIDAPTSANLITSPAAVDLFQFSNGIKGSGPLGFQPGIASGAPGDSYYSPMWRIFIIEWNDSSNAVILETRSDIDSYQLDGLITVSLARPMNSDHIINCPFIDPFQ